MADEQSINVEALRQGMLSATNVIKKFTSDVGATNNEYKTLLDSVKKLNENFKEEFEKTSKYLKSVVGAATGGGGSKVVRTRDTMLAALMTKLVKCVCKKEAIDKKNVMEDFHKFMVKDVKRQKTSSDKLTNSLKEAAKTFENVAEKAGKNKKGKETTGMDQLLKFEKWEIANKALSKLQDIASGTLNIMFGLDDKARSLAENFNVFKMAKDEQQFNRELAQTLYNVAGITGELTNMQRAYREIGQVVEETGMDRTAYQKMYLENLQGGIRDNIVLQKLTKQTLGTERLLGLEAGALAEHFKELNLSGQLTTVQTAAIGRGMVEVAKNTGLTGKHFEKAVSAAQQLNKDLIKSATLTAATSKNVLEIIANAQKLGVEDSVGRLVKAATNTNELMSGASAETTSFLYQAAGAMGRIQDLQMGIIARSKSGLNDLAAGMEIVLKRFGVDSLEAVENLPDDVKMKLNIQLKSTYGMELGEITRSIQAFKEAGKGVAVRLEEINKKQKQNLSLEEKTALLEQERKIKTNAALSVLTALNEAAKGAKNMNDALAKFDTRKSEFVEDVKALGGSLANTQEGLKFTYAEAAKQLNDRLAQLGKQPIPIDQASIEAALRDKDAQALLSERLEKGFQLLQTAEKDAADPMTLTSQTLLKYNDYFRDKYAGPLLNTMTKIMGFTGIMATAVVALGTAFVAWSVLQGRALASLPGFTKMFGKGGAGKAGQAAGGATKAAAPAATAATGSKGLGELIPKFGMKELGPQLKSLGTMLIGATAGIAMIGLAIVTIGAIMAAAGKALKVDPIKLALDVTKLIIAAAIITTEVGLATIVFDKALKKFGFIFTKEKMAELAWAGLKLALLVPAVVALAAGTLFVAKLATFGLTASDAFEIASNVTAVLLGAATIMGAVVAGAFLMLKISHYVAVLMKVAKPLAIAAAIGLVVLPIITVAIVGLSALMLWVSGKILSALGLDLQTIIATVLAINILVWGFNLFVLGLLKATMIVIAAGAALMAVTAGLPGWQLALIGAAGLVVAAIALAGILYLTNIALDKILEADVSGGLAAKTEAVIKLLDGFNKILLRLIPAFAIMAAIGIAAGILVFMGPAAILAGKVALFAAAIMFVALPYMINAYINVAQELIEAGALAAKAVDPKKIEAIEKNLLPMLETVGKILLRLVPIFVAMIAVGAVAGLLAYLAPLAPAVAIAALLAAIALPLIVPALILLGRAIMNMSALAMGDFNMKEKDIKDITDKIYVLSYGTMEISLAIGALGFSALAGGLLVAGAFKAVAAYTGIFFLAVGFIWLLIKEFSLLESAFSGFTHKAFMELTFKVMAFAVSLSFLNLAMAQFAAVGIAGLFGGLAALAIYSATLYKAIPLLQSIIKSYVEIGTNVYIASVMVPFEKVNKAFKQISTFTKNLRQFMTNVTRSMSASIVNTLIKKIFTQESLSEKVKGYLQEIKNVVSETSKAGIKRGDLQGAVVLFELLANFSKDFATAMINMQKATTSLTPTIMEKMFGGTDYKKMRTKATDILSFMNDLIADIAEKAADYNAGEAAKAKAYMSTMATVMTSFATAIEGMNKSIEKVAELQKGWFSSNLDLITKNIKKDGKKISQFENIIGQVFDSIKDVARIMDEKFPEGVDFDSVNEKMAGLNPIIRQFSELMGVFGGEMQKLFESPTWMGFSGKTGAGRFIYENKTTIKKGIEEIFSSIALILSTLDKNLGDMASGIRGAEKLNEMSKVFEALNPAMSKISGHINEFSRVVNQEATFLTAPGMIFSSDYDKTLAAFTVKMERLSTLLSRLSTTLTNNFQSIASDSFVKVGEDMQKVGTGLSGMHVGMKSLADVNKMFNDGVFTSTMDFINDTNQMNRMAEGIQNFMKEAGKIASSCADAAQNVPDNLAETNAKVQALSDFMVPLGKTLESFASNLGPLTQKGWFEDSIVNQVAAQASSVQNALDKSIELVKTIIDGVALIPDAKSFEDVNQKMNLMSQLIGALAPMLENFNKSMQTLLSKHGTDKSLAQYVKELTVKYKKDNPIPAIYQLIAEHIVKPLIGDKSGLHPDDVAYAADIMSSMGTMMKGLGESIQVINYGLASLTGIGGGAKGKTEVQAAKEFIEKSSESMVYVLSSMKNLVNRVTEIGDPKTVLEGATALEGVGKIFTVLAGEGGKKGLIQTINTDLAIFTKTISSGDFKGYTGLEKAGEVINQLAWAIWAIMPDIANLVDNINYWVTGKDAASAGQSLEGIAKILNAIAGTKDGEGLISFINTRIAAITKQAGTAEAPEKSLVEKAGEQIKNLAQVLPTILVGMSDLIDATFAVGPAGDVKFAAAVLGELPNMLGNVDKLITVMTSMEGNMGGDLMGSSAAIINSFSQLSGFVKTLNGGFLDTLIADVTAAVNKLTKLDQAMLALVQAFASIGNSMQQIGMAGVAVSAAGGVEVNAAPVVGTVAGLTAPGGGTGTQVAMATQTAMNSSAEIVAQIQVTNGLLIQVAGAIGGQNAYLEQIASGVTGAKISGMNPTPNIGRSLATTEIGGNSSNPKAGTSTNGGLGIGK